ncbi:MAG: PAS domain S-box protein, partial [Bacteroidota bacterium]
IAEISEIIRNHAENLSDLSFEVISYLVKYMKVNQGGIFVLMDDDQPYLELKGCYAYDRKKFMEKRIELGQGLIGQCYMERDIIHLKEVPKDYVNITSGLGEATPSSLVIVPIKNDQVIEGVMEIASFKDFEQYEIDFLTKVSENIAANITSAKVNSKTKELYEQSQQQSEELRAQEEEMRQNMEELAATQEEMQRKALESEARLAAINDSGVGSIEFDMAGRIVKVNNAFCELVNYTSDELIGRHHKIFVDPDYAESDEYQKFWQDLSEGILHQGEYVRYGKNGKEVILYGAYSVLKDSRGRAVGVLKFVVDFTLMINEIKSLRKKNQELRNLYKEPMG